MGCISSILALNREAGNVLTGEMTALAMERGDGAGIIIKNCLLRSVPRREAVGDGYEEDGTGYVAGRDEA